MKRIKKTLVLLFAATTLLAVSCTKEETSEDHPTLATTSWRGAVNTNNIEAEYRAEFTDDSTGTLSVWMVTTYGYNGEQYEEDFDEAFTYTYDGQNGTMRFEDKTTNDFRHDAANNTLTIYLDPESAIELQTPTLVLQQL